MSNINNHGVDMNNKQIKDIYSIDVQDLDYEAAATISGGALKFFDKKNGIGRRVFFTLKVAARSLGNFNNKASFYVLGGRDVIVYTGENFTGQSRRLRAGSKGNFNGLFNNNIESFKPV
ncbi:MAG: hypothetical protein RMX96_15570 [Nostoc sp. ChiSLP02]|nr:hypothetical protein [Nostoc sp. DedSLP05]MDZ8101941.1 hypothetical protein [Nostoc sp. DedSLP01]MDZ8186258.1 hypothetical protein [Nostoc sp. ChiSLP02]